MCTHVRGPGFLCTICFLLWVKGKAEWKPLLWGKPAKASGGVTELSFLPLAEGPPSGYPSEPLLSLGDPQALVVTGIADTQPPRECVLVGTVGKESEPDPSQLVDDSGLGSCVERDLQSKVRLIQEESYDRLLMSAWEHSGYGGACLIVALSVWEQKVGLGIKILFLTLT